MLLEAFALDGMGASVGSQELVPTSLVPGVVIGGRYAIQACVGSGAFGDVYRAEDTEVPGHVVALKILHNAAYSEEARQSARRELRLIASVFHPSVVQFKDHGWHQQRLWFVMPWYDGETLESRLQRRALSRHEALEIFVPLARALAAVHAAGIRHQDVKPENVFLADISGGETLPVLIDLGVAATDAEMLVAGTPTYFAPEVAAQFATVEHKPRPTNKADVFSLALALRNALEPSTAEDVPAGAVESFIEVRARQTPELPGKRSLRFLKPHWKRWLAFDAEQRPTAEEFARELEVLTAPETRRRRRNRILRRVVPAVLVLSVLLLALFGHLHTRAQQQRLRADRASENAAAVREDLRATQSHSRLVQATAFRLQQTREQLQTELSSTSASLRQVSNVRRRLENRVAALTEQISDERVTGQKLRDQLASLHNQIERGESLRGELSAELRAAQQEITQHRSRRTRLEEQLGATRERIAAADALVAAANARAIAADARSDSLESELRSALQRLAVAEPGSTPIADPPMDPAVEL